jgi:AcrR family transcriptional regulator
MKESSSKTNEEWSEQTRSALAEAAEELFATHGYANVSAEAIARAAGMTRGAIQYQFGNRKGLFTHVLDGLLQRLSGHLFKATMDRAHGVHEVAVGITLFAEAVSVPAMQRIVLLDGPAVLGWSNWRERCGMMGLPLLTHSLSHWANARIIRAEEVAGLAEVLLGATLHAALAAAHGDTVPLNALQLLVRRLARGSAGY